jgi:hypothetical protein
MKTCESCGTIYADETVCPDTECAGKLVPCPEWEYPERFEQFIADMHEAGIPVRVYHGYFWMTTPAVWTGREVSFQDVCRATEVVVASDPCAFDKIVFPAHVSNGRKKWDFERSLEKEYGIKFTKGEDA